MLSEAKGLPLFGPSRAQLQAANVIELAFKDGPETEGRCRDVLQALPVAIYTTDADGRITFFNEAAVALAGRRPQVGEQWCVSWKLFWPDGAPLPHEEAPMALALRENRPIRGMEAVAERPDGSRVPFEPFPTPIHDANGRLIGAVNMLIDLSDRKAAEERLLLLMREVDHRANNLLAVVQATVRLTEADTVEDFKATLEGRIRALARAHSLLARSRWSGVDLAQLVADELAGLEASTATRVFMAGPSIRLDPAAAQSVAVALHELASNAVRHGALSDARGAVDLRWRVDEDGSLDLTWRETGGPGVTAPDKTGFGSMVIQNTILRDLRGEVDFDWRPEGLTCRIKADLSKR